MKVLDINFGELYGTFKGNLRHLQIQPFTGFLLCREVNALFKVEDHLLKVVSQIEN
jgi:hypothetical protein